jgi:ABC-type transport system substrate-binding protein
MKPDQHLRPGLALLCGLLVFSASAGTPAAPDPPRRGGTLRLAEPTDLRSLDPAIAYDSESTPLVHLLFRGLLEYDDGVNLVPGQAKDWNISADGKTYTFHLRRDARFSNGRAVEADDYVFAFERVLNPAAASPGQGFFTGIEGAADFVAGKAAHVSGLRAPDRQTLVIQLAKPQFTFQYVLAMTFAVAVPRDVVQRYGKDFQYHLAGSGPYRLTEWRRGVRWHFARNAYYTGPDGYVDAVDIRVGVDDVTGAMMLERNEVDRVLAGPPQAVHFARDRRLRWWLTRVPTVSTDYLFMNVEMPPFDNVLVRRAVNDAVDKSRLPRLSGGFASAACGIVPPAMAWTNASLPRYDYDPAKARALLREAGFPNGFKTTLSYMGDNPILARLAEDIQQDLQQVGIEAALRPVNSAAFDEEVSSRHRVPFGVWGWFQDYPDPSDFLDVLFNGRYLTDTDCNNTSFYNNPAVNGLLDQAMAGLSAPDRQRLFQQAETQIMQDAPWVPLIHEVLPVLYHPRVHGTRPHPVWLWRFEWMWLDPDYSNELSK